MLSSAPNTKNLLFIELELLFILVWSGSRFGPVQLDLSSGSLPTIWKLGLSFDEKSGLVLVCWVSEGLGLILGVVPVSICSWMSSV